MSECLFCKIIQQEIPSYKIFEDVWTYAFLDISPVSIGHTLVIPKLHVDTLTDADPETLAHWMQTTQHVSRLICEKIGGSDFNLIQNNGSDAGQMIPHLHMHIIPRIAGDGLRHWPQGPHPTHEELTELAGTLRSLNRE